MIGRMILPMLLMICPTLCLAHLRLEAPNGAPTNETREAPSFGVDLTAFDKSKPSEISYSPLSTKATSLCTSSWNQDSFDSDAIAQTETEVQNWLRNVPTKVKSFSKEHNKAGGLPPRWEKQGEFYKDFSNRSKAYWSEYWKLLPPTGPTCKDLKRFGPASHIDQSKEICGAGSIVQRATATISGADDASCVVVSLGSNGRWEFEEAVFDALPCRIATFDCTSRDTMPERIRSRTTFYPICVDGEDRTGERGHKYMTWSTLMNHANIRRRPDILKMDIEGFEYAVLPAVLAAPQPLQPQQILMEMHADDLLARWGSNGGYIGSTSGSDIPFKPAGDMVQFVRGIYDAGYRFTYVDKEGFGLCAHCREVVAAKIFCGAGAES